MVGKNILPSGVFPAKLDPSGVILSTYETVCACAQSGDDRRREPKRGSPLLEDVTRPLASSRRYDHQRGRRGRVCFTAEWNADTRIKLLYLTPESVTDFMAQGLENATDASMSNSLPEVHLMLDKHRSEDDAYETVGEILRRFMQNHTA